jgi:two-component system uhpT operon response regulator UhpA
VGAKSRLESPAMRRGRLADATSPRVGLLEDHPIVRAGLRQLIELELGWAIALEAGTAADFMRAFRPGELDLLITDLSLPDRDGLVLLEQLHALDPELDIAVLSMHDGPLYRRRALQSGAIGFVSKRDPPAELVEQLRSLKLDSTVDRARIDEICEDPLLARLTPREREVMLLLVRGHTVARIARTLDCADKTVYVHRGQVMRKLGCDSLPALTQLAATRGWA